MCIFLHGGMCFQIPLNGSFEKMLMLPLVQGNVVVKMIEKQKYFAEVKTKNVFRLLSQAYF